MLPTSVKDAMIDHCIRCCDGALTDEQRRELRSRIGGAIEAECEACATLCDAFADQAMKATHETKDKDGANSFRGQRIAAANLAGQIRNRNR